MVLIKWEYWSTEIKLKKNNGKVSYKVEYSYEL